MGVGYVGARGGGVQHKGEACEAFSEGDGEVCHSVHGEMFSDGG